MKSNRQIQLEAYEYAQFFRQGRSKGFTYFFKELYPALLYYAFRIVNDRPSAEDSVSEAFIKIWKRHESFDHPQVIKSWLYTTVRNDCLNRLQLASRERRRSEGLALEWADKKQEPVINNIILCEVVAEVHNSIRSLPRECQKIFDLLYVKGMTVREISGFLGVSISTVKNQKARGLSILRKNFPELGALTGSF